MDVSPRLSAVVTPINHSSPRTPHSCRTRPGLCLSSCQEWLRLARGSANDVSAAESHEGERVGSPARIQLYGERFRPIHPIKWPDIFTLLGSNHISSIRLPSCSIGSSSSSATKCSQFSFGSFSTRRFIVGTGQDDCEQDQVCIKQFKQTISLMLHNSLQVNCPSTRGSEHGRTKRRQPRASKDQGLTASFDEYRQKFRLTSIGSQFDIIANNVYASGLDVEIPSTLRQAKSKAVSLG